MRQHQTAAHATKVLVGRGGDHIGDGDGVLVHAGGDEPGPVRHVHQQRGADLIGDVSERGEVDGAGGRGSAGDDELGPGFRNAKNTSGSTSASDPPK